MDDEKRSKSYPMRMYPSYYAKLQYLAKQGHRTIAGEIEAAIEKHIRDYESQHGPIPTSPK